MQRDALQPDWILYRVGLTKIEPDPTPIRFITITAEGL
jgi:LacI family transcriptional regulator